MFRKSILAIAAVVALGISSLAATDASAFGFRGFGGAHLGGGHVGGVGRIAHLPAARTVGRTARFGHTARTHTHVSKPAAHRPLHVAHEHHSREWCRHHHGCGRDIGTDVYTDASPTLDPPVATDAAPQTVRATRVAAVCNNDCDYFLDNEPGCYMAKRAFSTPQGEELRCVKICEEPAK